MGFKQGLSSPCVFVHKGQGIEIVVHGDDFTSLGVESELLCFAPHLKKKLWFTEMISLVWSGVGTVMVCSTSEETPDCQRARYTRTG